MDHTSTQPATVEAWLPAVGYEGFYEVSNLGAVRSVTRQVGGRRHGGMRTRKGILRSASLSTPGYMMVSMDCGAGTAKFCSVHRLVATAFIPNPDDKPQVNHKNGIKTDNAVTNLEWVTRSENSLHAYRAGLQSAAGSANGQAKLTEADIPVIRQRLASGESPTAVGCDYGVHRRTISDIKRGRTWPEQLSEVI